VLNASALLCRAPRRAAPHAAPVEVTLNGQQYTSDGARFVFTGTARDGTWPAWREQLTVTGLSPVTVSLTLSLNLSLSLSLTLTLTLGAVSGP